MPQVRNEIYDDNGLLRVEFIEVEEPSQENVITEMEAELFAMYAELKELKRGQNTDAED